MASSMIVQPSRLAYETRIKWNILILVAQLFLTQIGVWDLIMKVVKGIVGETIGWIIGTDLQLLHSLIHELTKSCRLAYCPFAIF
jgi:uncharacterized membrane protein YpjA